jgi:hypothetical protein
MRARLAILLTAFAILSSCSTVLFVRAPEKRTYAEPSYSASKEFFFWGLAGPPHDINASQICLGKEVDQVATTYTTSDFLLNLITVGIYSPRSVQVWCQL